MDGWRTRNSASAQVTGLDLPLKALIWQDEVGRVWLSYNDARWIAQRHGIDGSRSEIVDAVASVLAAVVSEATGAH